MQPVMITAALVGAELTRQQQPSLPLTPQEIADSAKEAVIAGASVIHLHVREEHGNPSCSPQIFRQTMELIRAQGTPYPILQASTGGAIGDGEQDRLEVLQAQPDMASLSMGSVNFGAEVFLNPLPFVEKLARQMLEKKIKPELEIFDVSMMETALQFLEKGWIVNPAHFQFVLGVPGALAASEKNLRFLVEALPRDATWSLAAIGRHQFSMMELALEWGGHCRVGFEDNIYVEKGLLAKTNAELIVKVALLAQKHHRPIASIEEARKILKL